jgi:hypothetical protein
LMLCISAEEEEEAAADNDAPFASLSIIIE